MPNEFQLRIAIGEILKLQDMIYISGGTSPRSKPYQTLLKQIKQLIQSIGLDFTHENIRFIFSFPFHPSFDVKNPCNISVCDRKECKIRRDFIDEIVCGVMPLNYTPYDLNLRIFNVMNNINGLTMGDGHF